MITVDVNQLALDGEFDRIINIEMFEHVRNYQALLANIANCLTPDGKCFVHHFCHNELAYFFNADESWMAKHFFKDGIMPSADLLTHFQDDLKVTQTWQVNGEHYAKTCEHWLMNLFQHKKAIIDLFAKTDSDPVLRFKYWECFIRACQQLFAFNHGKEWFVVHHLLQKK